MVLPTVVHLKAERTSRGFGDQGLEFGCYGHGYSGALGSELGRRSNHRVGPKWSKRTKGRVRASHRTLTRAVCYGSCDLCNPKGSARNAPSKGRSNRLRREEKRVLKKKSWGQRLTIKVDGTRAIFRRDTGFLLVARLQVQCRSL